VSNKYKFILGDTGKYLNLPIELKWDFYGRDDSIEVYQREVIEQVIGTPNDFEVLRFAHDSYGVAQQTKLQYNFYFFDDNNSVINTSVVTDWQNSYLTSGFLASQVYYYRNPFSKSFFKLDFYDTNTGLTQTNYFTVILPVQQGDTENVVLSSLIPNVDIKKPSMKLDYVGDSEGFFLYWLRKLDFINLTTFYMTCKFFDARLGVFVRMMRTPQALLPNKFLFNESQQFYIKVELDYTTNTYKLYDVITNNRIGDGTPINWYEYINP
jgi:hypothetical protein